jgi:hypothetical protein
MLKRSIILFLMAIVSLSVSAQKKNVVKSNNIKSVTEYKQDMEKGNAAKIKESYTLFDDDGNVLEEINYDAAGKVKTHLKYQYNSDNNKIKETEISPDGKVVKVTEYKYNGDLKTERNIYDGAGKLKSKKIYQYEYTK